MNSLEGVKAFLHRGKRMNQDEPKSVCAEFVEAEGLEAGQAGEGAITWHAGIDYADKGKG